MWCLAILLTIKLYRLKAQPVKMGCAFLLPEILYRHQYFWITLIGCLGLPCGDNTYLLWTI